MATTVAPAAGAEGRPGISIPLLAGLSGAGAIAAVASVWVTWGSTTVRAPETTAVVKSLLIASYVAVGVYTWWRRPRSRIGPLVATAGFLYALTALIASTRPFAFTVGRVTLAVVVAYIVYVFLCFPHDRLTSRFDRRFALVFAGATAVMWVIVLAVARTLPRGGAYSDCVQHCPENPLRLVDSSHSVTRAVGLAANGLTALGLAGLIILLLRRASSPAHLRRRAVVPLLCAASVFIAAFATYSVLTEAGADTNVTALRVFTAAGALAIPLALLVGQFRGRFFAATNLWRLLASAGSRQLTPAWVERVLASSLGDPSFALGVWEPASNGYVDTRGEPLELPETSEAVGVTRIELGGRPSLALLHDPALNDEPEIVQGLGTTAVMLLENTRLVEELQASRARIVDSAERERLRLERDLHDGAQQRLMAIQIKLALARERAGDGELGAQLDELASDASAAVEELRTLAHGIYPTVLRERGLGDALNALAKAVPILLRVVDRGAGRAASAVEAAIYYCSLEAIQNAVKHAGPESSVTVTLTRPEGYIDFEVRDDGTGFDPARHFDGIGLVSMRDRIAAVGGELSVSSSPGSGTVVFGSVPVASPVGD